MKYSDRDARSNREHFWSVYSINISINLLKGDSGGPLLCQDENDKERWFVGGIVSWGIKCAHPRLPGVYAYVPKYVPWILEEMSKYSEKEKG